MDMTIRRGALVEERGELEVGAASPLAWTLFRPAEAAPRRLILMASAMAVPQGFYAPLARWLAERGHAVVAFDYSGTGRSCGAGIRAEAAGLHDWVERDLSAVIRWVCERFGRPQLQVIGHSLGGQLLGLLPEPERVSRAITVAAGSGYFPHNRRYRLALAPFWYGLVPALTRLVGYFPGRALRAIGDLPRGVALDWARWCRHPNYVLDRAHRPARFETFTAPILALGFDDDPLISPRAIAALHELYRAAPVEIRQRHPRELGLAHGIGHFDAFRAERGGALWGELAAWLEADAPPWRRDGQSLK